MGTIEIPHYLHNVSCHILFLMLLKVQADMEVVLEKLLTVNAIVK